jgi:DNA-binding response OmpR family regulator
LRILFIDNCQDTQSLVQLYSQTHNGPPIEIVATDHEHSIGNDFKCFDAFIVDAGLDHVGLQICERIRSVTEAPIMYVCATAREKEKTQAINVGVNCLSIKPYNTPDLLNVIQGAVHKHNQPGLNMVATL